MRHLTIILMVLILCPSITIITAETPRKQLPRIETVDLLVDGSITPVRKNLTKNYDFVTKIHFELDYVQNQWIPSDFAASDPLENGTATISGNDLLFGSGNFTENDKVYYVSDSTAFIQDDKTPKVTHIYGIINLFEIMPIYGLAITSIDSLYFLVQDNLTAAVYAITEFQVLIQGFQWDTTKIDSPAATNLFGWFNEVWLAITAESFWVLMVFLVVIALPLVLWRKLR